MLKTSKHVSTVRQDRIILLYALVKGYEVKVGRIIEESILDYAKGNFTGNIPPSLLDRSQFCASRGGGGGVKFNEEEEERCLKTSSLTFAGVLKAPMESKERERRVKPTKERKMAETGVKNRDQAPTVALVKGMTVKGVDLRQIQSNQCSPLLLNMWALAPNGLEERESERENERSPSVEQLFTLKQRGKEKKRATTKESSNSELLAMLKEMKEEMKERDEHIRGELRWRDEHLEEKIKKI